MNVLGRKVLYMTVVTLIKKVHADRALGVFDVVFFFHLRMSP